MRPLSAAIIQRAFNLASRRLVSDLGAGEPTLHIFRERKGKMPAWYLDTTGTTSFTEKQCWGWVERALCWLWVDDPAPLTDGSLPY